MSWHGEPLVGFDLETTGTEPLEARIVTTSERASAEGRPSRGASHPVAECRVPDHVGAGAV